MGFYFNLFGESLTEKFNSVEEMATFFNNKYNKIYSEEDYLNFKIGGEYSQQGILFPQLPFSGIIIKDENFKERDFTAEEEKIFLKTRK